MEEFIKIIYIYRYIIAGKFQFNFNFISDKFIIFSISQFWIIYITVYICK